MTDIDIKQLSPNSITEDVNDINNRLFPVLRQTYLSRKKLN
jgi:hypothetical protein